MTEPFASIIQEATIAHAIQFSINPKHGGCASRLECTCGLIFAELGLNEAAHYNGDVRDRLWVEGRERMMAHLKEKGKL